MQFLIDARLPFLDPYISGENQSLLVETFFWVTAYIIFANVMSTFLRTISKYLPFWDKAKDRGGIFCGIGQDDAILLTIFCIHHGTAGLMMLYGQIHDDPVMWRHGYLWETGLEVGDLIALVMNMYPYRHDGMKSDIKVANVFHHLPGILLAGFVLQAGLHYNEHMRAIGMWLLLGACESCIGALYMYSLSIDTRMKQVAVVFVVNALFFTYCRFYQFPMHAYYLIQDVRNSDQYGGIILKLLYFGGVSLSLFNVGIMSDLIPKSIRYIKRAIDGVTPLEDAPVPKSREDRMKRRRSSIMMAVDAIDQATAKRRSSIETIMHLNLVEDMIQMDEGLDDIPEEDMAALNNSIASLNGKKTK